MIHNTIAIASKSLRISFIFIVQELMTHISICVGDLLIQRNGNEYTTRIETKRPTNLEKERERKGIKCIGAIEKETKTTNRYESHYIAQDFIMCVAMIKCIMATIHSDCACCWDYIVKYRKTVFLFLCFFFSL